MSIVPTQTITFSVPQVAMGDAVSIYTLDFWDGTQYHRVFENGVQLIFSITVFHGAQIGIYAQLINNYYPDVVPLEFAFQLWIGAIGQDPGTMALFQQDQEVSGFQLWSPTLTDWNATEDNDLHIIVGYFA